MQSVVAIGTPHLGVDLAASDGLLTWINRVISLDGPSDLAGAVAAVLAHVLDHSTDALHGLSAEPATPPDGVPWQCVPAARRDRRCPADAETGSSRRAELVDELRTRYMSRPRRSRPCGRAGSSSVADRATSGRTGSETGRRTRRPTTDRCRRCSPCACSTPASSTSTTRCWSVTSPGRRSAGAGGTPRRLPRPSAEPGPGRTRLPGRVRRVPPLPGRPTPPAGRRHRDGARARRRSDVVAPDDGRDALRHPLRQRDTRPRAHPARRAGRPSGRSRSSLGLSSVLIGTSRSSGLTVEASVRAIIAGVVAANLRLRPLAAGGGASVGAVAVTRLRFVERYEDVVELTARALDQLATEGDRRPAAIPSSTTRCRRSAREPPVRTRRATPPTTSGRGSASPRRRRPPTG